MKARNVIMIVSDTLRRDFLGCYGNTWIRTPNLDRFAHRCAIFDNAYVGNFPTVPARLEYFTGRYSSAYFDWAPFPRDEAALAEVLTAAGFNTMCIADTLNIFREGYNFDRGFRGFEWIRGQSGDRYRTSPREPVLPCAAAKLHEPEKGVRQYLRNVAWRRVEEDYFPAQTFRAAANWLDENAQAPFFLYLDTFDPHEPWDPPQYYVDQYDPGYQGEVVIRPRYAPWREFLCEAELKHCRALYAGEVSLVDAWVGFFLDKVERMGLLEDTVVIVTSDHGYYLGEHDWIGKSAIDRDRQYFLRLYEEVAHVPLLVYAAGVQPRRVQALTHPADLMPTILDVLHVPRPERVQGESLVAVLEGRVGKVRDFTVSGPAIHVPGRWRPITVTTSEGWCLIHGGTVQSGSYSMLYAVDGVARREVLQPPPTGPELYHLPTDPGQQENLINHQEDVAEELRAAYTDFFRWLGVPREALELRARLSAD